jgi:hypothetical protein
VRFFTRKAKEKTYAQFWLADEWRLCERSSHPNSRRQRRISAVALWAVGDATFSDLIAQAPIIFGGLGLATLGAKVDGTRRK